MAIEFESVMIEKLQEDRNRLMRESKLTPASDLEKYFRRFRERFGPDVLADLDGEELLETLFKFGNRDSLVYWLEFKNDDEFPNLFGGISGGTSYNYGLFHSKAGEWMAGSPKYPKTLDVKEAIMLARERRSQLVNGAKLLDSFPINANTDQYLKLQEELSQAAPNIADTAWGHKYFFLLHPEKIDAFHNPAWQRFYLRKMLIAPPTTEGRYVCAEYFVALKNELEYQMVNLASALHKYFGNPHRYWRVGTGVEGGKISIWDEMRDGEFVAVGWPKIDDLGTLDDSKDSRLKLKQILKEAYPEYSPSLLGRQTRQLLNFVAGIKNDEIVLACNGARVLGIARVKGSYEYSPGYQAPHRRPVEWLSLDEWKMPDPEGLQTTVHELKKYSSNLVQAERSIVLPPAPPPPINDKIPAAESYVDIFGRLYNDKRITDKHKEILRLHYKSQERAITTRELAKLVGYSAYNAVNAQYGRLAGLVCTELKQPQECNLAILVEFEPDPKTNGKETLLRMRPQVAEAIEILQWDIGGNGPPPIPLAETVKRIQSILEQKKQAILYGPPGTGKTYWADFTTRELASRNRFNKAYDHLDASERKVIHGDTNKPGLVRFCSFHPEYGYEHFIEGYKPEETDGQVTFRLKDGIFKKLCSDAEASPNQTFFLIIDEINRGDIPRIFGELITLLESDKRCKVVSLPVSGRPFLVPPNVLVIGTMNTADRSIALLDTALRRRFGFIELMPDVSVLDDIVLESIPIRAWLDELNRRIREYVGRDARNLQIGHSYFMREGKTVNSFPVFADIIRNDIIPLLEEYCYEDYGTLDKILGSSMLDLNNWRIKEELFDSKDDLVKALLSTCPDIAATEPEDEQEDEPDEPDSENDENPESES